MIEDGARLPDAVPFGIELAVLLDRFVGTERFPRRRRWTATVAFSNGEAGRISSSCLAPLGLTETDVVA
jgi:hypothetical protein